MVSAVIVNWNSGQLLGRCVAALRRHAAGCEIVVVDNASDDGSADGIAGSETDLRLVRSAENLGFAAANNAGWKRCAGDPILFLNPDVECREGAVSSLAQAISLRPEYWACAGRLLPVGGPARVTDYVRRLPTLSSVAAELLLLDEVWPGNPWTRCYRMTGLDLGRLQEVEQPAAACLMIRRERLEALGGFDERFRPAWFEDVDVCRRILAAGGKILLQPAALFDHHGGYSLNRLSYEQFLEYYHTNQIRYFAKHQGRAAARRVRSLVIAGLRLRAALCMIGFPVAKPPRARSSGAYRAAARFFSKMDEGMI